MKKIVIGFFAVCLITSVFAQEKTLLEIDDEKVTTDEFLHIYKKNNTEIDAMTYNAMKEYMELFVNFKLKVHEAQIMGMDTTASFTQELAGYRSQLAQPYLTDKTVEEELIAEAYERMKYDINVSHILIKADNMASPEDTLKAWNEVNNIYNKLVKGDDFVKLARQYSDDESVSFNDGDLGYRTVFGLVYEFETVMYNTPIGKFSKPFRTRFGYHILKVNDKRPAKGKFKVAHIMMVVPQGSGSNLAIEAKSKMEDIETKLNDGANFEELAKEFSEDRRTAEKGGEIGWITVGGKMIKEFEDAVFKLNNPGDFSPILKTNYGYHIIKLVEIEPIKAFDEAKHDIKSQISNSARTSRSRESIIKSLMTEYDSQIIDENVKAMYEIVTDSIFEGTWKISDNTDLNATILTFNDQFYTQQDFADYLMKFNRKQNPQNKTNFVDQSFKMFVNKMVIQYEESILEEKYPAFKYLIKEYHDGILLFELTDNTVWSKAITDTVGLENFYEKNEDNYIWSYRYKVKKYQVNNAATSKKLKKYLTKGWDDEKIMAKLNKNDSLAVVLKDQEFCEKGSKLAVDKLITSNNIEEKEGLIKVIPDTENNTITSIKVFGPQIKTLNEARGIITAEYQNFLEKKWIEKLHEKYQVVVHDDVLKEIVE
jgi:peptidyl-prolyl cis-trans isomerase SurA